MTTARPYDDKPKTLASLVKPPDPSAVLLRDEVTVYEERQHPAALIQPFFETFLFLLIVLLVVDVQDGSISPQNQLVVVILVVAAVAVVVAAITGGRRPTSRLAVDPFTNNPSANPALKYVIPGLFVLSLIFLGLATTLMISVVAVIFRMVTFAARWAFYERRYVTNRRLVEASGFLGSRVASMPLSRVTDIVYRRTIPAELLSYAHMRVETAGQDQALAEVRFITRPDEFYDLLSTLSSPVSAAAADVLLKNRAERPSQG
ncbi:MAG: PH domain-containing protein [Acidimicrobiales bacterium]